MHQLMHLRHPNILSFYGTMTQGSTLAIVTELMDGECSIEPAFITVHSVPLILVCIVRFAYSSGWHPAAGLERLELQAWNAWNSIYCNTRVCRRHERLHEGTCDH